MSDKLWQPQLKVKSPFSLLYLSHAHYTPRCEDVWWNKQQTEEFVVLRTASVVSICSWWCTVLKIYRLKAWICKVMFTTICLFGLYYILCAKLKLVLRAAHEVGRLIYLFLSSLHGAYALVRVRHEKHLVRVRGKSYFGYPVLVGTITYRNGPISCDGCNKNTWKHSLMALENIRQCDSNFGNWWPLVMNQTFLILAQFNSLCGMKEEKKSRFRLRITTPGRNIAGSAVHLHLKREQLCSNGGKCGPLQRPKMSQQFEHSTVTVLAALFGNNINDTQWSRWQL